ncbi:MAG: T9SS type A sorting domain-containing protein, partial [Bacteroidota bacterium]
ILVAGLPLGNPSISSNLIANNMISNIRSNGTATGNQAVGMGIGFGNQDRVVFNTVSMIGDMDPGTTTTATQSAAGIRVSSSTVANLTLKDNIVSVDVNSNTGTLKHYAVVVPSSTYVWAAGGSNFNDYFVNGSNTQMVLGGTGTTVPYADVTTLATWRTLFTPSNQDANSISKAVTFASPTDLHVAGASVGDLELRGIPITGVTTDFDGDTRPATFPYMGADEDPDNPLPITLASFTARMNPHGRGVLLEWTTLSEINNYGFYVERRRENETMYTELPNSFVPGHGTTNEPHYYSFVDSTFTSPGTYHYRLRQVDLDGTIHHTDPITINVTTLSVGEEVPHVYALFQNYPNPFNPETEIRFTVEARVRAILEVFNMLGQRVATLHDDVAEPGRHYRVGFGGSALASGVYFYRLQAGDPSLRSGQWFTQTRRLLLLR